MTKPDDIPQDVWDKAVSSVKEMNGDWQIDGWDGGIDDRNDAIIIVARAITAAKAEEREECAKMADEQRIAWQSGEYFGGFNDACNTVSQAIRNHGEAD